MIRAQSSVILATVVVVCSAATGIAHASEPGPDEAAEVGEERERLNGLTLGGAYTFHILRDRDSATTGEPLRTIEHLGGFAIAYDRALIPQHLALTISKPFYFNKQRFDSPFDVILRGLFRKGSWEGFIGFVLTWNIRVFEKEREEQEGERNILSLGIGAVIGGAYFFDPRWSLDLELGYGYIPTDDIVTHEVTAALAGAYHF